MKETTRRNADIIPMVDATGPKTFAILLEGGGAFAGTTLGQTKTCVDPQCSEGGRFTEVTEIREVQRDPDPRCLYALGYDAHVAGSGFEIWLSAKGFIWANDSFTFQLEFQDAWRWQQRGSEELVGFTMHLVDRKIRFLFELGPVGGWMLTRGVWRHGVFFSSLNEEQDPVHSA